MADVDEGPRDIGDDTAITFDDDAQQEEQAPLNAHLAQEIAAGNALPEANDGDSTTLPIANDSPPQQQPAPSAPDQKEDPSQAQEIELQAVARSAADVGDTSGMIGKYFKVESGGKMVVFKLHTVSEVPPDGVDVSVNLFSTTTAGEGRTRKKTVEEIQEEMNKETIGTLVPDSTNGWLYVKDTHVSEDVDGAGGCLANCTDNAANKFIAIFTRERT